MAAARLFGRAQTSNPLVTGVLIFMLFLAGVWFVTSPSKVNVSVNYENDAEIQALKAGAARASLSIDNAATLDRTSSAEEDSSSVEEESLRSKEATVQDELDAAKQELAALQSGDSKAEDEGTPAAVKEPATGDAEKEEQGKSEEPAKDTEGEKPSEASSNDEGVESKAEESPRAETQMKPEDTEEEDVKTEKPETTEKTEKTETVDALEEDVIPGKKKPLESSIVSEDEDSVLVKKSVKKSMKKSEKKTEKKSKRKSQKTKKAVEEDGEEPSKADVDGAIVMEGDSSTTSFSLCKDVGDDYIPCLDNHEAIAKLKTTSRYEHRERHCPTEEQKKKCLVPMPEGYQPHIKWPESRDQIWYSNVPRPSLANYKADQNWVKAEGDKFVFPGGGTQFKRGATQYIEWLDESCDELKLGDHLVLGFDVGCGVASFAAYLEPFGVRMMSIAPKDEHEAQIQFALERGVSSMVGVMGTMRQPYPANVYDAVHCARCRVPWYKDGGMLLAEVNRLIRPGGYFIWSATPLCLDCKAKEKDDKEVWEAMSKLTKDMCWNMIAKKVHMENGVAVAVYQKPVDNECYMSRPEGTIPPMCPEDDDADAAWYTPMNACLHKVPLASEGKHGSVWPAAGHSRQREMPAWLPNFGQGLYGNKAEEEFGKDTEHYENVMRGYLDRKKTPINWSTVRNVMDMDAHYGSFGASLVRQRSWSMNVIPVSRPNTLPVIFDRGLLGVYHDWCEAFNTYPRTYDLLHSDHLLGHIMDTNRCPVEDVMLEMDRILRPMGYIIVREDRNKTTKLQSLAKALHWTELKSADEGDVALLVYQKSMWRPSATK